jgi:hypothetical protein
MSFVRFAAPTDRSRSPGVAQRNPGSFGWKICPGWESYKAKLLVQRSSPKQATLRIGSGSAQRFLADRKILAAGESKSPQRFSI